jgi:PAS domain S-box-containing protein
MKTLLQILIVEDSEDDALLVLNRIKKGSYSIEYKIIDNALEMRTALNEKSWDLVLSDYSMPNFNGLKALDIIKESGIDIPFILISGTIGEEIAVEAMKAGAHDYIMKNNLHRLLPAIERELRDAKCREEQRQLEQKQKRTENELRESEERNRLITENTADTITMLDLDFNVIYTSPSVKKLRGFTPQEAMSQSLKQILTPKSYEKAIKLFTEQIMLEASKTSDSTRSVLLELEAYHKNGTIIWIEISVSVIRDNDLNPVRLLVVSRDITHRRLSEEQLQVLSFAVEQSPAMILITNTEGIIEYANQKFIELTGYTKDELLGKKPGIIKSGKMPNSLYKEMWNTIKANKIWYGEIINKTKDGKLYWVNIAISPMFPASLTRCKRLLVTCRNVPGHRIC